MNYVLNQRDHDILQSLIRERAVRQYGDKRPLGPREGDPSLTFTTTETILAYGCFVVSSMEITDNTEVITAAKPSTSNLFSNKSIFVNGPLEVVHDKRGSCQRMRNGTLRIAYDSSATPALGQVWGAKYGQYTLSQWWPGYRFCGNWDSDNRIGIWEPLPILQLHGIANSDIAKGSSGNVTIYIGPGGSEVTSTIVIAAYARGVAIASGKIVSLQNINGVWYVGCWET